MSVTLVLESPADLPALYRDRAGVEYVTAVEVHQAMPDVTAARLRDWSSPARPGGALLRPLTVGELAAVFGLDVADQAVARVPSQWGPMNVYRRHEVIEAERSTRRASRGRRRNIGQMSAGDGGYLRGYSVDGGWDDETTNLTGPLLDAVVAQGTRHAEIVAHNARIIGSDPRHHRGDGSPLVAICGAYRGDPCSSRVRCFLPEHDRSIEHEAYVQLQLTRWAA